MDIVLPSWFKQRQGKAESVGPETYRLTGPNLPETFVLIRNDGDSRWTAAVRTTADGPDAVTAAAIAARPFEAWEAAFELYRQLIIV
jgi:hypothetical protein